MGVRHHPLRGVDETGAFDLFGTRRRDAPDLQNAGRGGLYARGGGCLRVRWLDGHNSPAAEAGEDLREAPLVGKLAEVRKGITERVRHGPVDGRQDF